MPICPECKAGKHVNCEGEALDTSVDEMVECYCWSVDHEPVGVGGLDLVKE